MMTTNAIIYKGSPVDRCIRDFHHRLKDCSSFDALGAHLGQVIQKTVGVSYLVLVPLYRGAVLKPDVALHSDIMELNEFGRRTVKALPIAVKEFGPISSFFEDKSRTRNLVEHFGRRYFEKSQTYNEVLNPCSVKHSMASMMGTRKNPLGFIAVARSFNERGFTDKDLAFTDSIRTCVELALKRIAQVNDESSGTSEILKAVGDGLASECVVLNHEGELVWANRAAIQKFGKHSWRCSENHIVCTQPSIVEGWRRAIRQSALSTVSNQRRSDKTIISRIETDSGKPLYLIVESEAAKRKEIGWKVLSSREMEIADLAAQGYSPLNISAMLSISVGTVRIHLKSIYRKLKVSSRVELALRMNT